MELINRKCDSKNENEKFPFLEQTKNWNGQMGVEDEWENGSDEKSQTTSLITFVTFGS